MTWFTDPIGSIDFDEKIESRIAIVAATASIGGDTLDTSQDADRMRDFSTGTQAGFPSR